MTIEEQMEIIRRGTELVVSEEEIREKLGEGRPLRIKHGADASTPRLHLGHAVPLRKLRQFQELGHQVVFIIGDFTGRIGDPSGKSQTRRLLTKEEAERNAERFAEQAGKILDMDKVEVRFNSEWFDKMSFADVIELASKYTVARILERDDFAQRMAKRTPITVLELLYPLVQGYDSVAINADIEVGGTDQTFNFACARDLMRNFGLPPQCFVTVPLIEGLDGVEKMGKSLGNTIDILDSPAEKFGKIMSINDELMMKYFALLTDIPPEELEELERGLAEGTVHPAEAKRRLAREIVTFFDSREAAIAAEKEFDAKHKLRSLDALAEVAEEKRISPAELREGKIQVARLLTLCGLVPSGREARRMVAQGAVKIDGKRVGSALEQVAVCTGTVVAVGRRRVARLVVEDGG